MKLFWIDEIRDTYKTYDELLSDLNKKVSYRQIVLNGDPYLLFLEIISSMVFGYQIDLLDSDLSENEMKNMKLQDERLSIDIPLEKPVIHTYEDMMDRMKENEAIWRIGIYSSGTTGKPKRILHSFDTICRAIKKSVYYMDNVWALAYNPTHFAGIQVFLQAFMNMNTIVYLFDYPKKDIEGLITKYNITNLSATPTFYRCLLPFLKNCSPTVTKLTFGGEKYDCSLKVQLMQYFVNAQITNIYASTEAGSIFESKGEVFVISDKVKELVKVSQDNELLIYHTLLGSSEYLEVEDGWYHTGDIVEMQPNGSIRFLGRKTEIINVGGYKVYPGEVEEEIKKLNGVVDAVVLAKKNSITGNVLVAEVVIEEESKAAFTEKEMIRELSVVLQKWKVPRVIKFVKEIETSRTGKKVRR